MVPVNQAIGGLNDNLGEAGQSTVKAIKFRKVY